MSPKHKKLIQEIENAFSDVLYPGETKLALFAEGRGNEEAEKLRNDFAHKHWKSVPLDVLISNRNNLPFLTPEAFHFYLPAFMIAILLHPKEVGTLSNNTVFKLSPPEPTEQLGNLFQTLTHLLSPSQILTVQSFLKAYTELFPTALNFEEPLREAIKFWGDH